MNKADHHVGHLDSGVVDVVLHIDHMSGGPEQADERVAEDGVTQMPDMRGLVGIDAGVLDENLASHIRRALCGVVSYGEGGFGGECAGSLSAGESGVDVPGTGNLELCESFGKRHLRDDLFRNLARRLPKLLGEFKWKRHGELAHLDLRRLVDGNVCQVDLVPPAEKFSYVDAKLFLSL